MARRTGISEIASAPKLATVVRFASVREASVRGAEAAPFARRSKKRA
jgi:hypothetical protein